MSSVTMYENGEARTVADIPYSIDAEEAVLNVALVNPNGYTRLSYLKPEDFYLTRHQLIWQSIKNLHDKGVSIDLLALKHELERRSALADVGGVGYISSLMMKATSTVEFDFYGRLVEATSVRRSLMRTGDQITALARNEALDIDTVLAKVTDAAHNVRRPSLSKGATAHDAVMRHFDIIEERVNNPNAMLGNTWSITRLNKITKGKRNKLIVMAGRPGMGKSSALITEFVHSCRQGLACRLNTIEMTEHEVMTIITSQVSGVPTDAIESGMMSKEQLSRYVKASGEIAKWNFVIDDSPTITPMSLYTACLDQKHTTGLHEVYIDYLQLMYADGVYTNRVKEVDSISHMLAENAKRLDVPIVAAAQLSRGVEQRSDKRPLLADLRESGGIENEAFMVLLLYRDAYYNPPQERADTSRVEINVAKNRGGATGMIECMMHYPSRKFHNMELNTRDFKNV